MSEDRPVTALLRAWRAGDRGALDRLIPLVHDELHRLALGYMRGERPDHTLQATALVNEAYLKLVRADVDWRDRAHFFAVAATTMRRILVDHARTKGRVKRGGVAVSLEESVLVAPDREAELLAIDEALTRLAGNDERAARVVELHYFGGLTYDEIAEALGISAATVDRDLRFAKAWLYRELKESP
jgi:RNA polymerase sigma factor (TIGR02999 family)